MGHNLYQILKRLLSDSRLFSYSKYYDLRQIGEYIWKDGENLKDHISYPIYSMIANRIEIKTILQISD